MDREVVLVSACLAGQPCRYDSRARPDDSVVEEVRAGRALPACAEQLGGLPTPRPAAEIVGGDGHDVLDGEARVVTIDGEDVTGPFIAGAKIVADLAAEHGLTRAILQARSPSCGYGMIYDGTHTGELVEGDGVVAAMLKRQGVSITTIRGRSEAPRQRSSDTPSTSSSSL
ncbi:DUF523 domain-containing protein [Micromonospora eburnea]|uniref:Uncharacterized conserved protein YbbK, DUF523 family n=1 Tax=Micromonospora eburnea TaxID=227316 RepID=A0A1C6UJH1_9ACTN|nr:DUF523 domain-containing protein [Micromonospora eburnea]SCL54216.1 Uncharacterized conserved protein YbbK, DUF523 family [Micromonospora eburnea]